MKNFKKVASIVLALVMALAMTSIAFAANNGSIQITNAIENHRYTIYRIFDLVAYDADRDQYSYKINDAWNTDGFKAIASAYVNLDSNGYVLDWKTTLDENPTEAEQAAYDKDVADFAKAALAYAKANGVDAVATAVANSSTVNFNALPLGYYLLDSATGAICSLTTTKPSADIKEKNSEPTNVKNVQEDSNREWGTNNDASIGQTVNFKSTITAGEGAENYVFHDKMSTGLTFGSVTCITLNGADVDVSNYTVATNVTHGEGDTAVTDTFDVNFTKAFCDTLEAGDKIVIEYTAVLNDAAVVAGDGNINESKLTYGDDGETAWSQTVTKTWEFSVFKYTSDTNEESGKEALAGATFTLSTNENGSNPLNLVAAGEVDGVPVYKYCDTADCSAHTHVTAITTDSNGKFTIKGLDSDVYYLTETLAPSGYNKLQESIKVTIANNGDVTFGDLTEVDIDKTVEVLNNAGSQLPSTGGIGTTIFYIVGSLLVVAAAILLITKKRMATAQ